jgi:hypothetical protein
VDKGLEAVYTKSRAMRLGKPMRPAATQRKHRSECAPRGEQFVTPLIKQEVAHISNPVRTWGMPAEAFHRSSKLTETVSPKA